MGSQFKYIDNNIIVIIIEDHNFSINSKIIKYCNILTFDVWQIVHISCLVSIVNVIFIYKISLQLLYPESCLDHGF